MEQIVREISNKEAYKTLEDIGLQWDRKDANHIVVWTRGYKDESCRELESYLRRAGMVCVGQAYDSICMKTYSIYRHKEE
jgi:hypothetical protein